MKLKTAISLMLDKGLKVCPRNVLDPFLADAFQRAAQLAGPPLHILPIEAETLQARQLLHG